MKIKMKFWFKRRAFYELRFVQGQHFKNLMQITCQVLRVETAKVH